MRMCWQHLWHVNDGERPGHWHTGKCEKKKKRTIQHGEIGSTEVNVGIQRNTMVNTLQCPAICSFIYSLKGYMVN